LEITLQVEDAFRLEQVSETLPFHVVCENIDAIATSGEHVRIWWFVQSDAFRVSSANRTYEKSLQNEHNWLWDTLFGYHLIQFLLFVGRYARHLNVVTGQIVSWLERKRKVVRDHGPRIFNLDCRYKQYTTEWAIPHENAVACLHALHDWMKTELSDKNGLRPHFPIEIRWSAADNIYLSPSNGRRTCWIGIVQFRPYGLSVPYRRLFHRFEAILQSHGGRPHWSKTHTLMPDKLRSLYPDFDKFLKVIRSVDPHGMFHNQYVRRHLLGEVGPDVDLKIFKPHRK